MIWESSGKLIELQTLSPTPIYCLGYLMDDHKFWSLKGSRSLRRCEDWHPRHIDDSRRRSCCHGIVPKVWTIPNSAVATMTYRAEVLVLNFLKCGTCEEPWGSLRVRGHWATTDVHIISYTSPKEVKAEPWYTSKHKALWWFCVWLLQSKSMPIACIHVGG